LRFAGVSALLLVTVPLIPPGNRLWSKFHGAPPGWAIDGEDGSGVSVLVPPLEAFRGQTRVFVNGIGQSWLPYGDIHTVLGALPAFVHERPRTAAVIGLGSGDTVFAMAGRPTLETVTCIEIIGAQRDTLEMLSRRINYPGLTTVLFDPRIRHVTGDGRLYVRQAPDGFDLIEADALRPGSAYSGNLYSEQYFALLLGRLSPGGIAVTWAPTPRVVRSFLKSFPYVANFEHLLLGSNQPIAFDPDGVRERLRDGWVRDYYNQAGIDIEALLQPYLTRRPQLLDPGFDRSNLTDVNTDLFPRDEFRLP
jgi:spermidine synthase